MDRQLRLTDEDLLALHRVKRGLAIAPRSRAELINKNLIRTLLGGDILTAQGEAILARSRYFER
ncbi:hypothetical protein ACFSUK_08045 [Sphingobium scionense]|uniref:Uncharacterized protein n=1 Tax=Sphingobium scionense TaxID=1404341 RepID=A0A7W6LSX8_9SPHN|nr:hypothetical protein [Sphingobium scionense]MBB4149108.1 hypothetical protein [Sphingobium scionense]